MTTEIKHLTETQLSAMADGELQGEALWRGEQHLESCEACRDALADLSSRDAALGTALSNEPGEDYFASFADRVVGRIAAAEAAGDAAEGAVRDAERRPFPRAWWESPRRLAMVGGVAVVVLGAGVVLMTAREAPLPKLERASHVVGTGEGAKAAPEANAPVPPPAASAPSSEALEKDRATPRQEKAPASPAQPAPAPGLAAHANRMVEVPRDRREAGGKTSSFATPPPPVRENATTAERMSQLKKAAIAPAKLQAAKEAKQVETAPAPMAGAPAAALDQVRADRDEGAMRCGTVRDDQGRALAGVEVTAIDVARSTRTDHDGRFCLDLPPGEHQLQVLAVGFRPGRISVPSSGGSELAVTLAPVEVLGGGRGAPSFRGGSSPTRAAEPPTAPATAALSTLSGGDGAMRAFPATLRAAADEASRLQAAAPTQAGATGYDTAAASWDKLLTRTGGLSPEVEIRAHIAECRYLAWRRSPDSRRASAAIEALTAFIGRVPVGDRQNLATHWLDQVRSR